MLVAEHELLRRVWFPVARLQELSSGPVGIAILGTELVVHEGREGVTVAGGWCPHRGMKLSVGKRRRRRAGVPPSRLALYERVRALHAGPLPSAGPPPTKVALKTYPVCIAYACRRPLETAPWEPVAGPEILFHHQ